MGKACKCAGRQGLAGQAAAQDQDFGAPVPRRVQQAQGIEEDVKPLLCRQPPGKGDVPGAAVAGGGVAFVQIGDAIVNDLHLRGGFQPPGIFDGL